MLLMLNINASGGGRGVLKKRKKANRGRRWSSLSVRSLCEINCLIFQTANRVLSDKLLSSLISFAVLSLVLHIKVSF